MNTSPETRPKAIGSGRCGRVRTALRRALEESRGSKRMTLEDEIRAVLAERIAALCDDYAAQGDAPAMQRAAKQLDELVDRLPLRGREGDDGAGRGGTILELFSGTPSLGDTADA